METSFDWKFTVENEEGDQLLETSSSSEALHFSKLLEIGALDATGNRGDSVELLFNNRSSLILYRNPEQRLLRPQFPLSEVSGDGVEDLFCDCCGVQIDDDYSKCTDREIGFALYETILGGRLPESENVRWVLLFNYGSPEGDSCFQWFRRILGLDRNL